MNQYELANMYVDYVEQLYAAAVHHKKTCNESNCGVSLYTLKRMAMEFYNKIPSDHSDYKTIHKIMMEWPLV